MKNKLIQIKKTKFINALKEAYYKEEFLKTDIHKIELERSQTIHGTKTITLNAYGIAKEEINRQLVKQDLDKKNFRDLNLIKRISYTFIESEEKLALIFHIIASLSDHFNDMVEFWNYILEYPDELVESEYDDDEF